VIIYHREIFRENVRGGRRGRNVRIYSGRLRRRRHGAMPPSLFGALVDCRSSPDQTRAASAVACCVHLHAGLQFTTRDRFESVFSTGRSLANLQGYFLPSFCFLSLSCPFQIASPAERATFAAARHQGGICAVN